MTMRFPLTKDRNATIVHGYEEKMTSGPHGIGKWNSNGELLLALCTEFDRIVTNSMFKQKDAHKTICTYPRSVI